MEIDIGERVWNIYIYIYIYIRIKLETITKKNEFSYFNFMVFLGYVWFP